MAGIMSKLNEAESKFFESGGQDVATSLTEGLPESETPAAEAGHAPETESGQTETKPEIPQKTRDSKFVPLQALQEERAEKKQLREELKAYREWQAQLAQRLTQMPAVQPGPATEVPNPQARPLDYINHVLSNMQATTTELQQWRQQQE